MHCVTWAMLSLHHLKKTEQEKQIARLSRATINLSRTFWDWGLRWSIAVRRHLCKVLNRKTKNVKLSLATVILWHNLTVNSLQKCHCCFTRTYQTASQRVEKWGWQPPRTPVKEPDRVKTWNRNSLDSFAWYHRIQERFWETNLKRNSYSRHWAQNACRGLISTDYKVLMLLSSENALNSLYLWKVIAVPWEEVYQGKNL